MRNILDAAARRAVPLLLALLAACGGGGGSGANDSVSSADRRNGAYTLSATDTYQYTLTLDFDASRWRVQGNGVDASGTFSASDSGFVFDGAATGAENNARFAVTTDAVTGAFRFAGDLKPFIAARSFVTDPAQAVQLPGHPSRPAGRADHQIFTGEIAGGQLRYCNDAGVWRIDACPLASVRTGALTLSGTEFTAATAAGDVPFRIARSGPLMIFLRASPVTGGTSRRFWAGLPETAALPAGTYEGVNNFGESAVTRLGAAYGATLTDESGAARAPAGTLAPAGSPRGMGLIDAGADGRFFVMANGPLMVLAAANGNPAWPGYLEFGTPR